MKLTVMLWSRGGSWERLNRHDSIKTQIGKEIWSEQIGGIELVEMRHPLEV
jgi:hypothetical protein